MKFLPILTLILLLAPVFVFAQVMCIPYDPLIPCTGYIDNAGYTHDQCYPSYCYISCQELWDLEDYCPLKICCLVIRISRWLYFIAAGLAMIVIIWSGIMYMTAGGDETRAGKAKKILLYGLIGAMIVFASGYILGTIIGFLY